MYFIWNYRYFISVLILICYFYIRFNISSLFLYAFYISSKGDILTLSSWRRHGIFLSCGKRHCALCMSQSFRSLFLQLSDNLRYLLPPNTGCVHRELYETLPSNVRPSACPIRLSSLIIAGLLHLAASQALTLTCSYRIMNLCSFRSI